MTSIDADARSRLRDVANRLIPAAHGMPSAGDVLYDARIAFVLDARPDLEEPLATALRPDLGDDPDARLAALAEDAATLSALQLVIVAGYYTDPRVRELIGYPGQMAIPIDPAAPLPYVEEGLVEALVARGPVWRDPRTGTRATDEGSKGD
jgi:hypothetical protein